MKSILRLSSFLLIFSILMVTNNCTEKIDIEKYGQISGKVKNAVSGEPVSGALVTLSPSNSSTTTGSDGAYSFVELEPRQYSIQVMKDGFQTNTSTFLVVAGENQAGDILITPAQPVLRVSTTLLDYGTDKMLLPFEIHNDGAGQLTWSIADDQPWISANPTSGNTTAGVSTVSISIDRSQLGKTIYTGTVVVNSNGGSATINVTVNVTGPLLNVSTTLLDYGTDKILLPFEIRNNGAGELTWNIAADKPWITANPITGNTTVGMSTVSISIDRSQLGKTIYTGTVVVSSNGGSATINVTVNVIGPLLYVTPDTLDFGIAESEKTLHISNIGVGSLTYNAVASQTWITLQNASGTITTEIKLIQVLINRAGLSPGNYTGSVIVNSNGSNITIPVLMQVIAQVAPEVINGIVSNLNYNSAQISGNITFLGSSAVTQHGHCWSISPMPTLANSKTSLGSAPVTGNFSSNLTGLSPLTTYYVRAYATNSVGTAYSDEITLITDALTAPELINGTVSNLSQNSAQISGNITSLGNTAVTQHGHCWSISPTPTTANSKTSLGSAPVTGNFSSPLTGLSPLTTYYVRAYANNSAGTAYSDEITFITDAPPAMATVITLPDPEVNGVDVTMEGEITDLGDGLVTQHGHCYGTSENPTITGTKTELGYKNNVGAFTSQVEGLQQLTIYYMRAYATNSMGTSYGDQVSFTTGSAPPVVTNGLIAFYTFDDQTVNDWTANYNGMAFGGLSYSSETINSNGYSCSFDGSSSYIQVLNPISNLNLFTITTWFKSTSNGFIFSQRETVYNGIYNCFNFLNNKLQFKYHYLSPSDNTFSTDLSSFMNNVWHMAVISYQAGSFKLYIDGNLIETSSSTAAIGTANASLAYFGVGYKQNSFISYYSGKLDNIRIYNRILNQSEVTQIYNAQQ